jgi:hypothetical protein
MCVEKISNSWLHAEFAQRYVLNNWVACFKTRGMSDIIWSPEQERKPKLPKAVLNLEHIMMVCCLCGTQDSVGKRNPQNWYRKHVASQI